MRFLVFEVFLEVDSVWTHAPPFLVGGGGVGLWCPQVALAPLGHLHSVPSGLPSHGVYAGSRCGAGLYFCGLGQPDVCLAVVLYVHVSQHAAERRAVSWCGRVGDGGRRARHAGEDAEREGEAGQCACGDVSHLSVGVAKVEACGGAGVGAGWSVAVGGREVGGEWRAAGLQSPYWARTGPSSEADLGRRYAPK